MPRAVILTEEQAATQVALRAELDELNETLSPENLVRLRRRRGEVQDALKGLGYTRDELGALSGTSAKGVDWSIAAARRANNGAAPRLVAPVARH